MQDFTTFTLCNGPLQVNNTLRGGWTSPRCKIVAGIPHYSQPCTHSYEATEHRLPPPERRSVSGKARSYTFGNEKAHRKAAKIFASSAVFKEDASLSSIKLQPMSSLSPTAITWRNLYNNISGSGPVALVNHKLGRGAMWKNSPVRRCPSAINISTKWTSGKEFGLIAASSFPDVCRNFQINFNNSMLGFGFIVIYSVTMIFVCA